MNRPVVTAPHAGLFTRFYPRPHAIITLGLALLTLLTRVPFQSQILHHWDSVNFAYGLVQFDVASGQPHVPGYILYVLLGQVVNTLIGDHQTTLVLISMVSSALAVAMLYLLGRDMFGHWTGLVAAVLLASSPLFWFYGEIALPHTLDTFMITLSAWFLYRLMRGEHHRVWLTAVILGVLGGLRPQSLLFMGPLVLLAGRHLSLRRAVGGIVVLGLTCLAWFLPLIGSTGGLDRYLAIMRDFTANFNTTTSIFSGAGAFGLVRNLRKLTMYTLYGWAAGLLPAVLFVFYRTKKGRLGALVRSERAWFLAVWAAPTVPYYLLIHMGQQGLVFVYLPVLLLVSAEGLCRLIGATSRRALAGAIGALAITNTVIFLLMPTYPLGPDNLKLLTQQTLREQDAYFGERFDVITAEFPSPHTVVVAANWRHVQYYLPDYAWVPYDLGAAWEINAGQPIPDLPARELSVATSGATPDADGQVTLILFDPELLAFLRDADDSVRSHSLPSGDALYSLIIHEEQAVRLAPEGITLVTRDG